MSEPNREIPSATESIEIDCSALTVALRRFVRRFVDLETRRSSEDLVQEAVLLTWNQRRSLREVDRVAAFARTVLRRLRYRMLQRDDRLRPLSIDQQPELLEELESAPESAEPIEIAGEVRERAEVLAEVDRVLDELPPAVGGLLRGFYGGSPTRDLAATHAIAPHLVKARLYRARQTVRRRVQSRLDPPTRPLKPSH